MEAHLGRRLGDAELGGDLVVRQFVDVAQHDHLAQARRELGDGDLEASAQRRRIGVLGRVVIGRVSRTGASGAARRGGGGADRADAEAAQLAVIR